MSQPATPRMCNTEEEIWYVPTPDDCLLFVRERGQGSLVVVLHGGPGHSHDLLLNAFEGLESEYRFVFYDQRGALYSPCDESRLSHEHNIQDLELLRKELGVDKMTIVAHSAGALLALSYIERFSDFVSSAVLIAAPAFRYPRPSEKNLGEPVVNSSEHDETIEKNLRSQLEVEGLLEKHDDRSLATKERSPVARIYFAANFLYDVSKWKMLRGGGVFHNHKTEQAVSQSYPTPWDYTSVLQDFSGHISVINAANDYRINSKLWNHIRHEVAGMRYVEIECAGHALWIDQPEKFKHALESALQRSA